MLSEGPLLNNCPAPQEETGPPQPGNSLGAEMRHPASPKQETANTLAKGANLDLGLVA